MYHANLEYLQMYIKELFRYAKQFELYAPALAYPRLSHPFGEHKMPCHSKLIQFPKCKKANQQKKEKKWKKNCFNCFPPSNKAFEAIIYHTEVPYTAPWSVSPPSTP